MRNFITILVPLVFLCSCLDKEPLDASEVRKEMLEVQDQMIAVKKQYVEAEEKLLGKEKKLKELQFKLEGASKLNANAEKMIKKFKELNHLQNLELSNLNKELEDFKDLYEQMIIEKDAISLILKKANEPPPLPEYFEINRTFKKDTINECIISFRLNLENNRLFYGSKFTKYDSGQREHQKKFPTYGWKSIKVASIQFRDKDGFPLEAFRPSNVNWVRYYLQDGMSMQVGTYKLSEDTIRKVDLDMTLVHESTARSNSR